MASRRDAIKGITVKIGGDTTELGKALESVNKKSDNLSDELREINRMLKFDPSNTELLAQKQKVLADVIDSTSDKLETLKEAERQVQEQFARGDATAEQVRALQREIISTENKLKSYKKQADSATDETRELGDEAEKTGGVFEGMGGKLANAAKVGVGAIVTGAGAAIGALVASAEATREYRTEMGKLTTAYETVGHRTEIAEEAYKRLYGVIGETDQTVEAAQQIALLAESEEDVIQWADLGAGVVARFGDALQPETFFEAANETIKLGEATGAYVQLLEGAGYNVDEFNKGLAACTTESEKQAYMLQITDEILGDAADLYRETNAEVIRATEANAAWTATMAEAGAAVEPILTDVKLLGASLLDELMPGITGVTEAFRGLINGEEGSAQAVGEALSGLLTQIIDKAIELLPTLTEAAISLIASLAIALAEAIPGLVEAVVTALVTGIPLLLDGALKFLMAIMDAIPLVLPILIEAIPVIVTSIVDVLVNSLPALIEGAVQMLMGIVAAIPLLIQKLLPAIPTIVNAVVSGLINSLPVLIDGAIKLFFGILDAIPEIQAALWEEAPSIVKSLADGLLNARKAIVDAGWQLLEGLVKGMLNFDVGGALKKVGDGVINGFKKVFDIHSPSRVMAGIGELLDEGLAEGIEDGAKAPINALDKLAEDMVGDGASFGDINLERRMTHAFSSGNINQADTVGSKLDQIYKAILKGQVIMLDGKTLVGSTAVRYDNELGQRRVLAERGAL